MRAESAMHDICKHLFGIGRKRLAGYTKENKVRMVSGTSRRQSGKLKS